jgi:mRNA turnover protein 4
MKEICQGWKQSKCICENKTYVAEGLRSPTDKRKESFDDLCKLADFLKGKSALFFTNCEKSEVTEWFDNYSFEDFADPGTKVDHTITLPKGPMFQVEPHLGTYLKHLGLPITFEEGVVTLSCDYEVCKSGSGLKKNQSTILRIVGHKNTFRICLKAVWIEGVGLEILDANIDEDDDK